MLNFGTYREANVKSTARYGFIPDICPFFPEEILVESKMCGLKITVIKGSVKGIMTEGE